MALICELHAAGRHHHHDHPRRAPRRSAAAPGPDAGRPAGRRYRLGGRCGGDGTGRHDRQRRTVAAEGLAAGGELRAARPAAAGCAFRTRDRDRDGSDRGRPRPVLLVPGRGARGDRPARHEHADRRGRTEPRRGRRRCPPKRRRGSHTSTTSNW
jgi:hypothetical protein